MSLEISDISLSNNVLLKKGSYKITQAIASGSTAILYMAEDLSHKGNKIIIKEFYPVHLSNRDFDGKKVLCAGESKEKLFNEYKKAFYKECRITKYVSGNIKFVNYIDDFYENNTVYLVMEYIDGIQFQNYIEELKSKVDTINIVYCIMHVLKSIAGLHDMNVLHLDIKPANILIRKDFVPVIIDFGNGCFIDKNDSKLLCTSRKYSSPEVMDGNGTRKSDIYSLGVLIQNSLTRKEQGVILQLIVRFALVKRVSFRLPNLRLLIAALKFKAICLSIKRPSRTKTVRSIQTEANYTPSHINFPTQ